MKIVLILFLWIIVAVYAYRDTGKCISYLSVGYVSTATREVYMDECELLQMVQNRGAINSGVLKKIC